MPIIEIPGGGTLCTGRGVELFALLSLRGSVVLEGKGLRFRENRTRIAMQEFGIPGKATKKNRELVLAAIEKRIAEVKQSVALENMALTGENN